MGHKLFNRLLLSVALATSKYDMVATRLLLVVCMYVCILLRSLKRGHFFEWEMNYVQKGKMHRL